MKFNPKVYQGKDKIYVPVAGQKSISRIYLWDKEKETYAEPKKGRKYFARRPELTTDGSKSRTSKTFEKLQEAVDWQRFQPTKIPHIGIADANTATPDMESRYSFADLFADFKKHRIPQLRYGSRINYDKAYPLWSFFHHVPVEEITPYLINDWFDWLKSPEKVEKYKPTRTSFEREVDLLKSVLNFYIDRNYDTNYRLPFRKHHKELMKLKPKRSRKQKYMMPEECEQWLRVMGEKFPHFHGAALIQVEQLFRVSEVFGMTWDNVDFTNGIYRVTQHVIYPRITGEVPILVDSPSKTELEGGYFFSHLRERSLDQLYELRKKASSKLIFHQKGELWSFRKISWGYNRSFKLADLPYRGTHVCRHTGATRFLGETNDPLALQQMGNWATQKQAMEYGQITKDHVKKAVREADQNRRLHVINGGKKEVS